MLIGYNLKFYSLRTMLAHLLLDLVIISTSGQFASGLNYEFFERHHAVDHDYCSATTIGVAQVKAYDDCYTKLSKEDAITVKCDHLVIPKDMERHEIACQRVKTTDDMNDKLTECHRKECAAVGLKSDCAGRGSHWTEESVKCQENVLESIKVQEPQRTKQFWLDMSRDDHRTDELLEKFCNMSIKLSEEKIYKAKQCNCFTGLVDEALVSKCSLDVWKMVQVALPYHGDIDVPEDVRRKLMCKNRARDQVDRNVLICLLEATKGKLPEGVPLKMSRPLWVEGDGHQHVHPYDKVESFIKNHLRWAECLHKAMQ